MQLSESIGPILKQKGGFVCSVSPVNSVYDAIAMMAEKQVGALLVLYRRQDRRHHLGARLCAKGDPQGTLFQGNHRRGDHEFTGRHRLSEHTVGECMKIITDHRIRHLPVLDRERLVGMISIGDLVNQILTEQRETIRHLEAYITGTPT